MNKQLFQPPVIAFGILLLLFTACGKGKNFTVSGVVSGADGQMLYLENVGISSAETLDSVRLAASGKFEFSKAKPAYPEFYRLRLNNQLINFSIDSTESVSFIADVGTFATSYTVEGSENNVAIKNITLAQLDANQTINRLRRDNEGGHLPDTAYMRLVDEAVAQYKEMALGYIYKAPMSTAAYFALFQQIDGLLFFDLYSSVDLKAFAAVATSLNFYYPESARSLHLKNLTLQSMKITRAQREINMDSVNVQEISYLDIELPDAVGKMQKLSDITKGKVTLINFTAFLTEWSPEFNLGLRSLYDKFKDRGLVIYQVSLDADVHIWKNSAINLPWTCVHDPQSVYSQIAALYNVRQLPTIFLLNKDGDLEKSLTEFGSLESDVQTLLSR